MKIFCLVCLLCISSIPTVLLKPTVNNSEVSDTSKEEEARFRRQIAFFDLLHQAIEKYANSADVHLAPLKALANYKQYDTYAYPQRFSQQPPPVMGSLNPSQRHNGPHLKCKNLRLCSIQNPSYHSPANYNPNAAVAGTAAAKQKLIPYYFHNANNKIYMPISGLNHYVFENMTANFVTNYESRKNSTQLPPSQATSNGEGPKDSSTKAQLTTPSLRPTTKVEATTTPSTKPNNCTCLQTTGGGAASTNTTASPLPKTTESVSTTEKTKKCECPEEAQQEKVRSNSTAAPEVSVTKSTSQKPATSNQNLTALFLELDEMVHKVNNKELKEMLETLKTFKTAFEFNSTNKDCTNPQTSTTTTPPPAKKGFFTYLKEKLFGTRRQVKTNNTQMENSKSTNSSTENYSSTFNSGQVNVTKASDSHANAAPISEIINTKTFSLLDESDIIENLADIKSAFSHLNDSSIQHSIEAITNSTVLRTNLADHLDLMRLKEILISSLSKSYENTETNHQTTEMKAVKSGVDSSKTKQTATTTGSSNQTTSINDTFLETLDLFASNLSRNLGLVSPISNRNDTKITISITSNGNFKNIQVEQTNADKNVEINEKENMNMATSNARTRSIDMMGTGSRHVNILKQPEKKGPYAEPILSETYSDNSRFRTKAPLSIYWNKVEEKPLKFKRIPSGVFTALQSDDVDDDNDSRRLSNEEYLSTLLRKGIDYENIPHAEDSDSWLLT